MFALLKPAATKTLQNILTSRDTRLLIQSAHFTAALLAVIL
jgi:hypothetical protein